MEIQTLPKPLRDLVDRLTKLPGMGPKSALRAALTMLGWQREHADALGRAILELREKLCLCERCNAIAEDSPCRLCADPTRDDHELMLVSQWDSLLAIEQGGFYRGRYMVLGGLLDPLAGVDASALAIDTLADRLREGEVREVILALGTTMEAEATGSHIINMIRRDHDGVHVTRLAQGIPLGAEVKFMDKDTLRTSLKYRQGFEDKQ